MKSVALIFIFALFIRLLYFPDNIYFGYDQARDAYESQSIYKNLDIKIIGPSTSLEGIYHGPLYWYIIGPAYLIANGNPYGPALLLLILNAVGVFLIFLIGKKLGGKTVGLVSALLYAISFEQTQYALYFGNPGPAVITVMLFYLGFVYFGIEKKWWGILIAIVGLALSVQFQFFLVYLWTIFIMFSVIFAKNFRTFDLKRTVVLLLTTIISFSTFIYADVKYGGRTTKIMLGLFHENGSSKNFLSIIQNYLNRLSLHIEHNIFSFGNHTPKLLLFFSLLVAVLFLWKKDKKGHPNLTILLVWFLSSSVLLFLGGHNLYYSNVGISAGIILLASYLIVKINKSKFVALALIILIALSNLNLVRVQNPKGIINDIYVQEGMLLEKEKSIIDYIYINSKSKPIVVSATTMPLKINTTWAYLFNWYGEKKYGYLPFWAGEVAAGYPGNLPRWTSQVPEYTMFTIIEPTRGVRKAFIDNFLEEQEQYGKVLEEKKFGDGPETSLVVQKRK